MNAIVQTKAVQNALETIRATATQLRSQIAQKEQERQDCESEIHRLRSMPVCFDDWLPQLKEYIAHRGRDAAPVGSPLTARGLSRLDGKPYTQPFNSRAWSSLNASGLMFHEVGGQPNRDADAFDTLCFYFPEVVFEKLSAHYRASAGSEWAMRPIHELPSVRRGLKP